MAATNYSITRRLAAVLDDLQSEFRVLCDENDFENKLNALKKAGTKSDRASKLRMLFDLFDKCGIEYERGKDNEYYEQLVRASDIPTFSDIGDRMLLSLFEKYDAYPSPEDYMKRIVDRLSRAEDGWQQDTLRLRILKQFIKYGNYLTDAKIEGKSTVRAFAEEKLGKKSPTDEEVLSCLSDDLFNALTIEKPNYSGLSKEEAKKAKQRDKDRRKEARRKTELLKIADDLASGKFRSEGATKKYLYLFAMVFDMTYYSGSDDILDPVTDLETNLFRDYYANNLMRFITDTYKGKRSKYENDPSGQGINYKNFAEMIYLYYISGQYSPQDKIRLSDEMIQRVKKDRFQQGKVDTAKKGGTKYYRGLVKSANPGNVYSEDLLRKSEEEFEQFICDTYDCETSAAEDSEKGVRKMILGPMQVETEQVSAFREYQKVLEDLRDLGVRLENCNYGLRFTDVAAFKKNGQESFCRKHPEIDPDKFASFVDLLQAVNDFMGYTPIESESTQSEAQEWTELSTFKTKALFIESPKAITRTSLLVAYYYYYNALNESAETGTWMNLEELYNDFKECVDPILDAANYQPISGKNIIDLFLVFSAYAYLNVG